MHGWYQEHEGTKTDNDCFALNQKVWCQEHVGIKKNNDCFALN